MTNPLAHLSDADLAARLAKLEAMGKETARRIASGERGTPCGIHISRGRYATSFSLETALNTQRLAWKATRDEIRRRASQA